jgi:hypothetical protein
MKKRFHSLLLITKTFSLTLVEIFKDFYLKEGDLAGFIFKDFGF